MDIQDSIKVMRAYQERSSLPRVWKDFKYSEYSRKMAKKQSANRSPCLIETLSAHQTQMTQRLS